MIIKTKLIFRDEYHSDLIGQHVEHETDFVFDLSAVSGIIPDGDGSRSVIFMNGADLIVKIPFSELRDLWVQIKLNEGKDQAGKDLHKVQGEELQN